MSPAFYSPRLPRRDLYSSPSGSLISTTPNKPSSRLRSFSPSFTKVQEAPAHPRTMFSTPLIRRALKLSLELSRVSLERDSLSRELLRAIRQKVALTQELEAWQVRGRALRTGGQAS